MLILSAVKMGSVKPQWQRFWKGATQRQHQPDNSSCFPLCPSLWEFKEAHPPFLTTCLQERPNPGLKEHVLTPCDMGQDQENQKQSFVSKGHPLIVPLSRKQAWVSGKTIQGTLQDLASQSGISESERDCTAVCLRGWMERPERKVLAWARRDKSRLKK